MTQDVLSNMSSDEINSISDTTESLQVATIIRQKYFDIINRLNLPDHEQLIQLTPSVDGTTPVLMYVPDGVCDIKWLKYFNSNTSGSVNLLSNTTNVINGISSGSSWATTSTTSNTIALGSHTFTVTSGLVTTVGDPVTITETSNSNNAMFGTLTSYSSTTMIINVSSVKGTGTYTDWSIVKGTSPSPPGYQYVTLLPIQQFIDMVNTFDPSNGDVYSFTLEDTSNLYPGAFTFYYKNDHTPQYATILSNFYVIFDSYDSTVDTTLQGSKTMVYGEVIPAFEMVDTFIPNLAEEQFQLLLNEAKALAFYELKQQPHQLAMQETKRGWSTIQKQKSVDNKPSYFNQLPNFGRKGNYTRMPFLGGVYSWS